MTPNEDTKEITPEEVAEVLEEQTVYIAASDVTLHCKPVQGGVLQSLLSELSTISKGDLMNSPEVLMTLKGNEQLHALESSEKLFSYCAGWGIEEDPPDEVPEILELMGVSPRKPNIYRAAWVRYALGATQDELGKLVGVVIALTFVRSSKKQR